MSLGEFGLQEWLDLGVAVGTVALAVATYWLARKTSSQSDATVRLAEIAQRQLDVTSEPRLRVQPSSTPGTANLRFSDNRLMAFLWVENVGAGLAEVEHLSLKILLGDSRELDTREVTLARPTDSTMSAYPIEPESASRLDFDVTEGGTALYSPESSAVLVYRALVRALGSGSRYLHTGVVSNSGADDIWRVDRDTFEATERVNLD